MSLKLETLRQEAEKLLEQGQSLAAVRAYLTVLRQVPRDYRARIALADALARAGEKGAAARVYGAAARLCIQGGLPLTAIVAIRATEALELGARERGALDALIEELATTYGRGSPRIGAVGGRMNVTYPEGATVDDRELRRQMSVADLVAEASQVGSDLSQIGDMPPAFAEVPLLSKLSPERFAAVVKAIWVQRLPAGHVMMRRGSPGSSCYLIAAGKVSVTAPDDAGVERQLALLGPGTLVGEMAVISGSPRLANVTVKESADVLELDPEALAAMGEELDQLAPVLDQLAQNRWMKNLLEQSPLFRPFSSKDRQKLMQRCSAYKVPKGTTLFAQGGEVKGIYLLLRGEVQVQRVGHGQEVIFETKLVAGATLGIRENLEDKNSDAKAMTLTPCTVLFLSKSAVQRLIEAVPEFAEQLKIVSEKRVRDVEDAEQRATLRLRPPLKRPDADDAATQSLPTAGEPTPSPAAFQGHSVAPVAAFSGTRKGDQSGNESDEDAPTTLDLRRLRPNLTQDDELDAPTIENQPKAAPPPPADDPGDIGQEDTVRAKIDVPVAGKPPAEEKRPAQKPATMEEEDDGIFTSAPPMDDDD